MSDGRVRLAEEGGWQMGGGGVVGVGQLGAPEK